MPDGSLQDFVKEVNGESHLRVEHDFGDGFVRLQTSEAERRQAAQDIQCSENIVLELLRNSRDAHAAHVFVASSKEGDKRLLTVIDDGDGIPPTMHLHVFEPRVTSKLDSSHMDTWGLHGRGMALYSIAENASIARIADSDVNLGCVVHVQTDTSRLPEKTDQSSFPRFELSEGGTVNIRGPRNILRTSCEFAIDARASCSVYVGSPAEMAASIYSFGESTLSAIDRAFCKDSSQLPIVKRLATASDPADFVSIAATMGIGLSERTARRIMDGQISPVAPLIDQVVLSDPRQGKQTRKRPSRKQGRLIRLEAQDAASLTQAMSDAFTPIAERYYLDREVKAQVRVAHGQITVTIPVVEKL